MRQGDNDLVADNRSILRVIDPKDLPAAAMNRERLERDAFKEMADLLKRA